MAELKKKKCTYLLYCTNYSSDSSTAFITTEHLFDFTQISLFTLNITCQISLMEILERSTCLPT